jgi:hypothetical protein
MAEQFLPRGCEITSDEQGNHVIVKKCKSAVRAEKKREKMERVRQRDEQWALEQSARGLIVPSDSEDYAVDDQKTYECAPSPLPNPFATKELYLPCIRCASAGMVEYTAQYDLGTKLGKDMTSKVSLASTICRTCYNKHCHTEDEDELIVMMKAIKISPFHFLSGPLMNSLPITTDILTEEGAIAYIPFRTIINNLNDSCILMSMEKQHDKYVPCHLKGGFF